ncbi:MAG: protein O-mannosyl-transferase family, partial [bacterium]
MTAKLRFEIAIPLAILGVLMIATMPAEVAPIDGGELSAVAQSLGVAHPTGYPLWTVVARLVAMIPVGPTLPWRLGVFSCAAALAALALVAPILAAAIGASAAARARAAIAGAALLLGGSMPVFLEVARGPEVYALSLLALGLVLRVSWEAARRALALGPAIVLSAYVLGLGSGVHMTLVLVAPALVLAAWRSRPRAATWVFALAFAILGRTIYAYLPIRSACQPALDWGNPETWHALNAHAFAWQYRVWMLESGDALLKNLSLFARESWSAFSVVLALAPLGIARLARHDRGALMASALMFVAFLGYSLAYSIHDIALYFLPAQLVLLYWIAAGSGQILEWIEGGRRGGRGARGPSRAGAGASGSASAAVASPSRVPMPAALALAALLLVPAALSWRANAGLARREAHAAEWYARSLLESLPGRAIVLSRNWDIFVSPSIYLQSVAALRPDVSVLDQEHFRRSWYAPLLARTLPDNARAAERETAEFLRLLAPFEAGGTFDRDALQAAYERMIRAFLDADPTRPLFATSDVEPTVLRAYAAEPFGLALRLLRNGETRGVLYRGEFPACDTAHLPRAGEWERFAASVAGDNALANAEYAVALGDTALARQRLADAARLGRAA